jgi:Holliday junction DNA helicase RuvB
MDFERHDLSPEIQEQERPAEVALRPRSFGDFVGQERVKRNLKVFVQAARQRGTALDHVLFCGPPGLGKTTLAHIIASELGVDVQVTSGPAIDHRGVLAGLLTQLTERSVLFIDEIHRMSAVVEEYLYPALEDLALDVPSGTGAFSQTLRLNIKPFTLVGATTRSGLLTSPLRDRFGIVERLEHYSVSELYQVIERSARLIGLQVDADAARELGSRARGTPRIANRLLRRVRDFAEVEGDGSVTLALVRRALDALQIDDAGLDRMDRALLRAIIEHYGGGPVGVETLAATLHEDKDTLENEVEPFLIQQGFVQRTSRGRLALRRAYEHLGLPDSRQESKTVTQGTLFE